MTLIVRPYRDGDYDAVLPLWQAGFAELGLHLHRSLTSWRSLATLAAAAGVAAALQRWTLAGAIVAGAAALLTPVGRAAVSSLIWPGVWAETRRDMTPAALRDRWATPGQSSFWVAESDGVVVGCVGVRGEHTLYKERRFDAAAAPPPGGEASVWRLSVAPSARRLGVGRALMAALEAWAVQHGYTSLTLVCGNPDSKKFYASLGYTRVPLEDAVAAVWGVPGGEAGLRAARGGQLGLSDRLKLFALRGRVEGRGNILGKPVAAAAAAPAAVGTATSAASRRR